MSNIGRLDLCRSKRSPCQKWLWVVTFMVGFDFLNLYFPSIFYVQPETSFSSEASNNGMNVSPCLGWVRLDNLVVYGPL